MAAWIVTGVIVLLAVLAARKQFRKGEWTRSCVGCAGRCSGGSCRCGSSGGMAEDGGK